MNYIQKQAALQKLAQVRLAINYVMRNRGMKKQAEGELSLGDERVNPPEYKKELPIYSNKTGPYSPYLMTKQVRDSDIPVGNNTFGGLTNRSMNYYYNNPNSFIQKNLPGFAHPWNYAINRVRDERIMNRLGEPVNSSELNFSPNYWGREQRAQSLIPNE